MTNNWLLPLENRIDTVMGELYRSLQITPEESEELHSEYPWQRMTAQADYSRSVISKLLEDSKALKGKALALCFFNIAGLAVIQAAGDWITLQLPDMETVPTNEP